MKTVILWFKKFVVIGCLCSLGLAVYGCETFGTYNAATGRNEFIAIPTSEEVSMGQKIHGDITRQYKLSDHAEYNERLERIGQRLALVSDRQDYEYNFFLVESEQLNAFTTPGGNIYVHTGLMDQLDTDDQVAAVVAHEIGHCAARHTIKKFQAAMGYNLIGNLILSQLEGEDTARSIAAVSSSTVMTLVFSSYGRKDEFEADRLGIKYMNLAGYDLRGMVETLGVLESEAKGPNIPLILRSHPHLNDRIFRVKEEIKNAEKEDASFEVYEK